VPPCAPESGSQSGSRFRCIGIVVAELLGKGADEPASHARFIAGGREARPVVADRQFRAILRKGGQRHRDEASLAAREGMLHGIADHFIDDEPQRLREVAVDRHFSEFRLDADTLRAGLADGVDECQEIVARSTSLYWSER
jgi:hypothetical protein